MNIMCLSIYVGLYWFSSLYFVIFTVQILSRFQFSSVQFSRSVVSNSLQLHESQHARPPSITNSQSPPKPMSIELTMPSNHLILCHPLLLLPSNFTNIRDLSNESALCIRWPSIGVLASASVLPVNLQDWFPLGWLAASPCSPRDTQDSSSTPPFKSPVLTTVSWPAYRFLKRKFRWSGIPITFRISHSLLWFTQSKALA